MQTYRLLVLVPLGLGMGGRVWVGRGVGWGEVGWGGRLQLLGFGLGPDKAVLKLSTDIDWTGLDSFCILLLLIRHMHMIFLVYTHCQLL